MVEMKIERVLIVLMALSAAGVLLSLLWDYIAPKSMLTATLSFEVKEKSVDAISRSFRIVLVVRNESELMIKNATLVLDAPFGVILDNPQVFLGLLPPGEGKEVMITGRFNDTPKLPIVGKQTIGVKVIGENAPKSIEKIEIYAPEPPSAFVELQTNQIEVGSERVFLFVIESVRSRNDYTLTNLKLVIVHPREFRPQQISSEFRYMSESELEYNYLTFTIPSLPPKGSTSPISILFLVDEFAPRKSYVMRVRLKIGAQELDEKRVKVEVV